MSNKDKLQVWRPQPYDFASSKEKVHHIGHVIVFLSSVSISRGPCEPCPYLKIELISRLCHCGFELIRSRPCVRAGILALLM